MAIEKDLKDLTQAVKELTEVLRNLTCNTAVGEGLACITGTATVATTVEEPTEAPTPEPTTAPTEAPTPEPTEAPEPTHTLDEVRKALKSLIDGKGKDAAIAVINAHGARTATEIDPSKYASVLAEVKKALV